MEGSTILAYGNRVEEFANILNGETRRPFRTGLLNPAEPKSLQMLELALTQMCGEAQKGEKICFSIPSGAPNNRNDILYHERTIAQILEKLAYSVKSLNEGLAVIYAELEKSSFTGIGISFGGGMCNVCLAYLGLPVVTFSTPQAGDYVDYSASSVTGQTPTTIQAAQRRAVPTQRIFQQQRRTGHLCLLQRHDPGRCDGARDSALG